jgi:hypothetical protein
MEVIFRFSRNHTNTANFFPTIREISTGVEQMTKRLIFRLSGFAKHGQNVRPITELKSHVERRSTLPTPKRHGNRSLVPAGLKWIAVDIT